jgi:hypothetical protein
VIGHTNMVRNRASHSFVVLKLSTGDLAYASMPGVSILNINSIELAHELLGKRTSTTSYRKIGYMVKHLMGWEWNLAFMDPDPPVLEQRKLLRRGIGPQRIASHNPLIEKAAAEMMVKLKMFEGDPAIIVKESVQVNPIIYETEMCPYSSSTGQMVIQLTYGEQMWKSMGAELAAWNTEAMGLVDKAFVGVWLVDIFPIRQSLSSV